MRAYSASDEEALRARNLLKDWAAEGFITAAQHQQMEQETICDLRRTNIFLRIVLFLFTLIIVGAAAALFFRVFLSQPSMQTRGIFLVIFAGISYAAAEFAVSRARLHRYGIEEALAACSVGFICAGIHFAFFEDRPYLQTPHAIEFLTPAAGVLASLWIWRRFGLPYAFLVALIFVVYVPGHWTSSQTAQHLIVTAFYAVGLIAIIAVRSPYRFTYLNDEYSIAEALLWLGIYLAINLQISSGLLGQWLDGTPHTTAEFSRPFYWTTWVLTWCLPPAILARGLLTKDRFVIAVGAIAAVLTLVTNKPYLGWPRHTWDPMLLGALLFGLALFIRRWLAKGPGEIRRGFTARRLSGKDKRWMDAATASLGVVSTQLTTPTPQPETPGPQFGGGDSGGAGASSDF